jgi:hypothetical protein
LAFPVGTELVLDLGAGQLVVCTVNRSHDATFAVEFETPSGQRRCRRTVHTAPRIPYALAAAGMKIDTGPNGKSSNVVLLNPPTTKPQFMEVTVNKTQGAGGF